MGVFVKHTGYYKYGPGRDPLKVTKNHLRYILSNRKKDGLFVHRNKPVLFNMNEDKINKKDFYQKIEKQRKSGVVAHKLVFSLSEDERDHLDINLKELVRETLQKYQYKYNVKLDWAAVIHDDKGHPHAHIVIRGKDTVENKAVHIKPFQLDYLKKEAEKTKQRIADRNLERGRSYQRQRNLLQELEQEREIGERDKTLKKNRRR